MTKRAQEPNSYGTGMAVPCPYGSPSKDATPTDSAGVLPALEPADSLKAVRILVTRSTHQSHELADKLTSLGAEITALPVIDIVPPDSWEPLDNALVQLDRYNWLLFASTNAVRFTAERLRLLGLRNKKNAARVAVIGSATKQSAQAEGFRVSFCPDDFTGEALVAHFPGYPTLQGQKVLWPRTDIGRIYVLDELRKAGAQVDAVVCYRTTLPENHRELGKTLLQLITSGEIDVITLNSAQSARNFAGMLQSAAGEAGFPDNLKNLLKEVAVAAIGPETSAAAREVLGKANIEARVHTLDGLVDALRNFHKQTQD